jgi:hypothetical protein
MKESIHTVLRQTDPGDSDFRDHVFPQREGEKFCDRLERILGALNIEIQADRELINAGLLQSDIIICNHPSTIDILLVGVLLGEMTYTVVTQRKRAPALKKLFGDEFICPVPLGENESLEFIVRVNKCLSSGRKLVLFPSGGSEIKEEGSSWFDLYKKLLNADASAGKKILPLHIDIEAAQSVQKHIGDMDKGREIFPEIHYTMPDESIPVPVVSGEVFVAGEKAEEQYREAFL